MRTVVCVTSCWKLRLKRRSALAIDKQPSKKRLKRSNFRVGNKCEKIHVRPSGRIKQYEIPKKTGIIIDFGVLCNAIIFGVSIFFVIEVSLNLDRKTYILVCSSMHLPSACRFFRGSISARISTKNHRLRRALWCIYLRRVDFLRMNIRSNFDEKS